MIKRWLALAVGLGAIAAGGGWIFVYQVLSAPMDIANDALVIDINAGTSLRGVADDLAEEGALIYPRSFSLYGRLTGKAGRIQAGEYEILVGTSALGLLDQLVDGQVKLHSLTIVEGWTVRELLAALMQNPAVTQTISVATAENLATILELGVGHAEGQFFPDTYHFPKGTTDVQVLAQAHQLMREQLDQAWEGRSVDLRLNDSYELLILASIVERETALDRERPLVAGVFVRRLDRGMRLQTDPTVIYGLGTGFDGNLTREHLQTDTPYNTYTRSGLPPTPIGLPGGESLHAAANPDQSNALYFVATGEADGSHFFTETLEEHNAAVAKYLARLRQQKN